MSQHVAPTTLLDESKTIHHFSFNGFGIVALVKIDGFRNPLLLFLGIDLVDVEAILVGNQCATRETFDGDNHLILTIGYIIFISIFSRISFVCTFMVQKETKLTRNVSRKWTKGSFWMKLDSIKRIRFIFDHVDKSRIDRHNSDMR